LSLTPAEPQHPKRGQREPKWPRHLQPTAVRPLTFALSVRRGEQIQLREGLEPTLVGNEIASAVALGEGLPETFFEYGCVPQESRTEVYELTKSVKDACGRHLAVIVEIGGALRRAKELLGHGNFLPWLKAEFRWSERTARNYMSLAAHFQGKTATFTDLDLGTARTGPAHGPGAVDYRRLHLDEASVPIALHRPPCRALGQRRGDRVIGLISKDDANHLRHLIPAERHLHGAR
jgi:hypothetical protein